MKKLNVIVGFVYTQVMFCDENGKLHLQKVMTDVDKPWKSIMEVLSLVITALSMDKPSVINSLFKEVHIQLQFKKVNYSGLLATLREEMSNYLSDGCFISIQTLEMEEEVQEKVCAEKVETVEARPDLAGLDIEVGQAIQLKEDWFGMSIPEPRELEGMEVGEQKIPAYLPNLVGSNRIFHVVEEECLELEDNHTQRGSPVP